MTPKERAEYLIKRFEDHSNWEQWDDKGNRVENEKLCAIICVEQIIEAVKQVDDKLEAYEGVRLFPAPYWEEVLSHLKNS